MKKMVNLTDTADEGEKNFGESKIKCIFAFLDCLSCCEYLFELQQERLFGLI